MDTGHPSDKQLAALASHLAMRRKAIMQAWRKAVERDPEMNTGTSLPRAQLNDHIPDILDAFGRKLVVATGEEYTDEHKHEGAAHGLQRWQQGYDLREVTREWGRLQLCVADELENYASTHSDVEPRVMSTARRAWAEICTEGVIESTAKYFQLQQIEAMGNVRDLEGALKQMDNLERQRAELWREAVHDLRGNLGVVVNVTAGLSTEGVPEQLRDNFIRILDKNVSSLRDLLEEVTSLARLQAGREQRQVKPFDAAIVLRELCARTLPLAEAEGLYLHAEGPVNLEVEGDAIKVQRIAQNLLFNAIKYTSRGGVRFSWGDSRQNDANRWMLCVQDTGPGFHAGPGAPIAGALEDATVEARHVEVAAREAESPTVPREPDVSIVAGSDRRSIHQERGEGVGLSIVKRLCELLDATVEMESKPGEGTTVRILFPRSYGG